jgi:hypothetical protein
LQLPTQFVVGLCVLRFEHGCGALNAHDVTFVPEKKVFVSPKKMNANDPPSDEELDRQRRFIEQERLQLEREKLALERDKLRRERRDFDVDTMCATELMRLATFETSTVVDAVTDVPSYTDADISRVGRRVCRWWEGNKRFFPGQVVESKVVKGRPVHRVLYDDGDEAWESDIVDVNDPDLPICKRTPSCWKMENHCGKCIGMKKKPTAHMDASTLRRNALMKNRKSKKRRRRQAPSRLAEDGSWASLQSRRWHSLCQS